MDFSKDIPAKVVNAGFFDKLDKGLTKEASQAGTDFTRLTLREEGVMRKILPPQMISAADLDKQLNTDKPVKILDKEPSQPVAISVPFGTLPENYYMHGSRYQVTFARLVTPNIVKDVREIEQYDYDIRDLFKNNSIKDLMTAEDIPFFAAVNEIVGATPMAASTVTGKIQYHDYTSATGNPLGTTAGFTRETVVEALKIMSRGYPNPSPNFAAIRLQTSVVVMNVNTGREFLKFGRDEIGGDLSEELFKNGLSETTIFGHKFIFTIKDDLVLDGEMYMFAEPQFLGRSFELEAPTMFVDKRAFLMEFFCYSCLGASIGNGYAVAKAKLL